MPVKKFKPTSAGRRFQTTLDFSELSSARPEKSPDGRPAVDRRPQQPGATDRRASWAAATSASTGSSTSAGTRPDIPAKVASIEYDPNRTARIALLHYADGEKRYILAPNGLQVGAKVVSGPAADILPGNALPLRGIPLGTTIHNLELKRGRGGQLVRSAGAAAQLMAKEGDYAQVRLPSGEVRRGPHRVLRHDRPGREPRARERLDRQGRAATAGWAGGRTTAASR